MADLQRIEIRDRFAPDGPTVLADVAKILSCTGEDPRPGMQHITVSMPLTDPARMHCQKRRVLRRVMSDGTWREYRITRVRVSTGLDGARFEVTGLDPVMDLTDADVLREVSATGIVRFDIGLIQATVSEALDNLIIARLPAEYSYFATGTTEPTGRFDIDIQAATPLAALEAIVAKAAPAEYYVRQTDTAFYIDVVTEIGAAATIADIRGNKNLVGSVLTDDSEQMATVALGVGADDGSGTTSTLARCAWRLANPVGTTYEITDPEGGPSPVLEDGQLEGFYVVPNTASDPLVAITNTTAGSPATATLASATGIVDGGVYELRADSAGTLVTEINSPSRVASYGRKVATVARETIFGARNHVPNAFFSTWTTPTAAPDGYTLTQGGGSAASQNTDPLFTKYGGKSWKLTPGSTTTTQVDSPVFWPRPVVGALAFATKLHLFLETFTGDCYIEIRVNAPGVLNPTLASHRIIPVDYPGTPVATDVKVAAGDFVDIGIEALQIPTVPSGGLQLQVFLVTVPQLSIPGSLVAYLDALLFTQTPALPPTFFEFSGANALHHESNTVLAQNRDGFTSYEVDVIDVTRLDGTAFPHDALVTGGTVRVSDEEGVTTDVLLRLIAKPAINWLVEGDTQLTLNSRQLQLSDVLGQGTAQVFARSVSAPTPLPPPPVPDDAILTATPTSLTFNATEGGANPAAKTVALGNDAPLHTLAGPTLAIPGAPGWLTGVDNGDITGSGNSYVASIQPTVGALTAAGSPYTATINFSDTEDPTSPRAVGVTLNVAAVGSTFTAATITWLHATSPATVRGRCGFPVKPGWLQPSESTHVRLVDTVAGTDIACAVSVLGGTHEDGSAKFVSIEFDYQSAWGASRAAQVRFGEPRDTGTDLTPTVSADPWDMTTFPANLNSVSWKTETFPKFMINADKTYLATTRFWAYKDAYDLRYEGQSGGPAWQQAWFDDWKAANTTWWNNWVSFAAAPSFSRTQYDFPAHTTMLWVATGDAEYYKRACATLVEWRNRYFRANPKDGVPGGNIAMWEHCPWGLGFHYWLTGDPSSQPDLGNEAYAHSDPSLVTSSVDDYESEPRPLSFLLYALCAAKAIGATCPSGTWDTRINSWVNKWLTTAAAHPGWITSGTYVGGFWNRIMYQGNACSPSLTLSSQLTQNYMLGLLTCAIDQYIQFGDGTHDAIAETRMAGLCDFLLTMDGTSSFGRYAFRYNNQSLACSGVTNSLEGQINLNGIYGGAMGVAYARLGTAAYQTSARSAHETTTFTPNTGDDGPYIYNQSRAYNETFHRSWESMSKIYP